MKNGLEIIEMDELLSQIHSHRFRIMQHYMFLYADRLDGKPCRYDRYNEGRLLGAKEGEGVNRSLNIIHQEELKLGSMLNRLEELSKDFQIQ